MSDQEKQPVKKVEPTKVETSPELPSKNMEDARQDALVNTISEDEIDNKIAEETGKDQPLPEDVEEVNNLKDSEVKQIANDAASAVAAEPNPPAERAVVSKEGKFVRFKRFCGRHKAWTVIIVLLAVVGILSAIPYTRYAIAGLAIKQQFSVVVTDSETKKPVTSVAVTIDGRTVETDNKGKATLKHRVGPVKIAAAKAFYTTASKQATVPILKQKNPVNLSLKATGRQVSATVIDRISGKPISQVTIKGEGNVKAQTDSKGKAELVVPADKKTIKATLTANGYNTTVVDITIGEALKANEYSMTPTGKLYFLSNKSGRIDVVKTDLDGTNRQTVVEGTGKEDATSTALLASRDWKYLALYSKRDGGTDQKIFLIDTSTDKMSVMDEGNAYFQLIGWSGHNFTYAVNRNTVKPWEPKYQAIKSFNAESRKLAVLDENEASGTEQNYVKQSLGNYYIAGDKVVYSVNWSTSGNVTELSGKSHSIRSVNATGQNKKDIRTFDAQQYGAYIGARAYAPEEVYFWLYDIKAAKEAFFEYDAGSVKDVSSEGLNLTKEYPTLLLSPSGKMTAWSDTRDGKLALFTGTANGSGEKQLPGIVDYTTYGWFTDKYILATQKGSELYILSSEGGKPLKVSDYYKPGIDFRGYGSGYGGL